MTGGTTRRYDDQTLLEAVADIVPRAPATTQAAFDAARASSPKFADCPPARRVAEQLAVPWARVLELAAMTPRGRLVRLGHLRTGTSTDWLTPDYATYVLTLVARRLRQDTLSRTAYTRERDELLRVDRRRWMHGGTLQLPTSSQIEAVLGSWPRALSHAGLRSPKQKTTDTSASTTIVELLERFYEHYEVEPTTADLAAFARGNGIPHPRKPRPWKDYLAEWKDSRRTAGLPVPAGPPPRAARPDYSQDVGAALPGERRQRTSWADFDECVDWVARYLGQLGPGERASERGYDTWVSTQDGGPHASALSSNHGGWSRVRDAAWALLAQG